MKYAFIMIFVLLAFVLGCVTTNNNNNLLNGYYLPGLYDGVLKNHLDHLESYDETPIKLINNDESNIYRFIIFYYPATMFVEIKKEKEGATIIVKGARIFFYKANEQKFYVDDYKANLTNEEWQYLSGLFESMTYGFYNGKNPNEKLVMGTSYRKFIIESLNNGKYRSARKEDPCQKVFIGEEIHERNEDKTIDASYKILEFIVNKFNKGNITVYKDAFWYKEKQ